MDTRIFTYKKLNYKQSIHWFRRDLRITDNTSLDAAAASSASVTTVYIVSDWKDSHNWTGEKRQHFLCESLHSLANNLKTIDGELIIRKGDAVTELLKMAKELKVEAIFTNRDPDPFGQKVEARLCSEAEKFGIAVHVFQDVAMHERSDVLTNSDSPYRVFTPYSRKWHSLPKRKPSGKVPHLHSPKNVKTLSLPELSTWNLNRGSWEILAGGEKSARERLKSAMPRIPNYDESRDVPSLLGTSRLSQDLRFGTLSIRQVYAAVIDNAKNADANLSANTQKYLNELAWRDFYMQILWHFPEVLEHEFNAEWRGLPWCGSEEHLERWKSGETGFPIVDAGIRELLNTGFMHNRVRMIVAMFLTKDLHIDWRVGEHFFMQHLVDGEIASNNGGWQWSAGTGADAAPYFRIQNPWTQTKRYDSEGIYIKKWVPELANIHPKLFCEQPKSGLSVASGYVKPIVDHTTERNRTLDIFKKHKELRSS